MKLLLIAALLPTTLLAACLNPNSGGLITDPNECRYYEQQAQARVDRLKEFRYQQALLDQQINGQIEIANINARAQVNGLANVSNVPLPNNYNQSINNGSGSTSNASTSSNSNSVSSNSNSNTNQSTNSNQQAQGQFQGQRQR